MRLAFWFLFGLAVLSCTTMTGQQPDLRLVLKVPNPVAVDGIPDAGYYVLSADNVVYRYNSGLQFSNRFALDTGDPLDLRFVRVGGQQDSVLVTQWANAVHKGFVHRYSPQGSVVTTWETGHVPMGVDFDPRSGRIYFATMDSNELYSADIQGGDPHVLCEVYGGVRLGPIALDVDQQRIYASDGEGKLFVVALTSKKVTQLDPSFGLVSALRFDSQRQILFVADQVKKRVYTVDVSAGKGRITSESVQFTSPSGLAYGPENSMLVTDQKSSSVYLAMIGSTEGNKLQKKMLKRKK